VRKKVKKVKNGENGEKVEKIMNGEYCFLTPDS